jgi:Zn-dependent protease
MGRNANAMGPDFSELMLKISVWTLPLLFAITLHELGHAWAADKLGDPTARLLGRVSLNPIRHIDPFGTILVPLLLLAIGGFVFGWAKPVPVDGRNLRHPQRDMALVAVAGPIANLVMALGWALVFKLSTGLLQSDMRWAGEPLRHMASVGIFLNVVLAVLNMLPLPPLDGGSVLSGFLPRSWADAFNQIAPYGLFILLALVATGMLSRIIGPPVNLLVGWVALLFGLRF